MASIDSDDELVEKNRKSYEKIGRLYNALTQDGSWHRGYERFVKRLLQTEGDINYEISKAADNTPNLLWDVLYTNIENLNSLLNNGLDFTCKDEQGRIAIYAAIENKIALPRWRVEEYKVGYINAILKAQVNFNNPWNPSDRNGITHFHAACMTNNARVVEFFLNNGVDVNDAVNVDSAYFAGFTPLHLAVEYRRPNVVKILLKYGANVHAKNAAGLSSLHVAVKARLEQAYTREVNEEVEPFYDSIIKILVNFIIDNVEIIESIDDCGFYPLHAACILPDTSLVERILQITENVDRAVNLDSPVCPGYTSLHFAVFCRNFRNFELLLEMGADIQAKNARGFTAFDLMCLHNQRNLRREIHSVISTIDDRRQSIVLSDNNQTKLMDVVSAMESKDKFVVFLMNNQNIIDSSVVVPLDSIIWPGYSVLHITVMLARKLDRPDYQRLRKHHHSDMIEECLERGADVTIKDAEGSTPIHLAFNAQKYDIAKLLLDHHCCGGRTENHVDKNNLSHFHIACALGHQKMVEHFLSNGVNVNSSGSSPAFTLMRSYYLNPANSTLRKKVFLTQEDNPFVPILL